MTVVGPNNQSNPGVCIELREGGRDRARERDNSNKCRLKQTWTSSTSWALELVRLLLFGPSLLTPHV